MLVFLCVQRPEWAITPSSSTSSLSHLDATESPRGAVGGAGVAGMSATAAGPTGGTSDAAPYSAGSVASVMRDRILLAACGAEEVLPQSPDYPHQDCTQMVWLPPCLSSPVASDDGDLET